jgi:predicted GH43/DUF377 family glycosyl hydrolase
VYVSGLEDNSNFMKGDEIISRYPGNPIIKPEDIPLPGDVNCVFNSGAAVYKDEVVMLLNVWDKNWEPKFLLARSKDGIHFDISSESLVVPPQEYPYVPHEGIFDTRITPLEGYYYITYNVASRLGGRVMLARTKDFTKIETVGFIAGPDHRNCVLFPEKIGGLYVRLDRPHGTSEGDIYISYSPDLIYWGRSKLLLEKNTRYWESAKVGPGAPPVKTPHGWLVIYHGCRKSVNGYSYQAGCMLLDLNDPSRVIGKMRGPLMSPKEPYERIGNVNNVIFPTAAIVFGDDPDELKIYYGAADTYMALATAKISKLVEACLRDGPISYKYNPGDF